ncbi:MAG TPA: SOS response-associated peptidase [Thermoanaerobaculia bacterium]|nr:SOS response-associated peptidase [Thermoanaerobaculia bacterium]
MCGRYTLSSPGDALAEVFGLPKAPQLPLRFNIAPTQESAVVRAAAPGGGRRLDLLRWGLVPYWAEDKAIGNRLINARAESAAEKPAFGESFRRRRCLVAADGFYEWKTLGRAKQPFLIRRPDRRPFAFAGLWSRWRPRDGGDPLETYAILTTAADERIGDLHDRMPVILDPGQFDLWLDPEVQDPARLAPLLRGGRGGDLELVPVSTRVNKPENDGPDCIEPLVAP